MIKPGQIYQHCDGDYVMALYVTEPAETVPGQSEAKDLVWLLDLDIIHIKTWKRVIPAMMGDRVWAFVPSRGGWIPHSPGVVYLGKGEQAWFCPLESWNAQMEDGQFRLVQEVAA